MLQALYFQFGIKLHNVMDTQVITVHMSYNIAAYLVAIYLCKQISNYM
jgi:hypothetical protein